METPQDRSVAAPTGGQAPPAIAPPPPAVNSPAAGAALPSVAPLGEAYFTLVRQAKVRHKAVHKASRIALSSAIVTLFIGVTALPLVALFPSNLVGVWVGVLTAIGVCIVGVVEFIGYRRMRRADPTAAKLLGRNQLAFLALITAYCVIQMVTFSPKELKGMFISQEFREQAAALPSMTGMIGETDTAIDHWAPLAIYGFYGLVIVLSAIFQGGLAIYYFTRRRRLEAFNSLTPTWVRRMIFETQA